MRYRHLFESNKFELQIIPGNDLLQFISDNRRSNKDVFDRLHYLYPAEMDKEIHFVHIHGRKLVSSLALQLNPYDESEFWLKHIEVDERYRNRGLASQLYQAAVDYARDQKKAIKRSSPSDLGKKYMPSVVDRIKKNNPDVEIRDPYKY